MDDLDHFITYLTAEKRCSAHTTEAYRRDITEFIHSLCPCEDPFDPAAATAEDLREWIAGLSESGMKPATVNRKMSSVKSFYRYLFKIGRISSNPMVHAGNLRREKPLPSYITESEADRLLDQSNGVWEGTTPRERLIVMFLYSTGIRVSELCNIRLGDLSHDFSEVRIMGKGSRERILPLVGILQNQVKEYVEQVSKVNVCISGDYFLFLTKHNRQVTRNEVYRLIRGLMQRAGINGKKSPHVLRHTFATHLLNNGADIRDIQQLLGHTSLSATQIYAHTNVARLKSIYSTAHPRSRNNNLHTVEQNIKEERL